MSRKNIIKSFLLFFFSFLSPPPFVPKLYLHTPFLALDRARIEPDIRLLDIRYFKSSIPLVIESVKFSWNPDSTGRDRQFFAAGQSLFARFLPAERSIYHKVVLLCVPPPLPLPTIHLALLLGGPETQRGRDKREGSRRGEVKRRPSIPNKRVNWSGASIVNSKRH